MQKSRFRIVVMNLVRVLLAAAFVTALINQRALVLIISIIALLATFLPTFLKKFFKFELPGDFEVIILLFIYGSLFLAEVRGAFDEFWWWGYLLNLISSFIIGLMALTLLHTLYKEKIINASPALIAIFTFALALSFASLWELFEFSLDVLFGFNLQKSTLDTIGDLASNAFGAFVVSLLGYFYLKRDSSSILSTQIRRLIERNSKFFKSKETLEPSSAALIQLISKGEGDKLEFKSTLRTNLHTKEHDKKIELAVLKTIVAYLNSDGGTLLIGVSDSGQVVGLEADNFQDNDALALHFTNLLKQHIGSQYIPFIDFSLHPIEDKHVLKVECRKSEKPVFLKFGKEEDFFIRNGPSSARLHGSALVDYISHSFRR